MYSVETQPTFQRRTSPPSSGSKNKPIRSFTCQLLHADFFRILLCDHEMDATCSSETSIDFQPTAWRYILLLNCSDISAFVSSSELSLHY
jgi:hypothetical protein